MKQDTVEDVLKVEERLALPADQSPGILRCLDVEYFASVLVLLLNGSLETEIIQDGLEECLGVLSGFAHDMMGNYFLRLFFGLALIGLAKAALAVFASGTSTTMFRVSLVCRMLNMFCTVQ